MKKNKYLILLISLIVFFSGCTTMQKLNPFSKKSSQKCTIIQEKQEKKHMKCYGRDNTGECVVW